VEQRTGRGGLRMPADVARPRKILALLAGAMPASCTFEPVLPLDLRKIFLAVQVRFEAIGELYQVMALENIHKIPIFIDFKDMQLSTDL
jgi:transcription initiation factor TFIIIB Brf1 subunit/transcription initiation factor TFIIB